MIRKPQEKKNSFKFIIISKNTKLVSGTGNQITSETEDPFHMHTVDEYKLYIKHD